MLMRASMQFAKEYTIKIHEVRYRLEMKDSPMRDPVYRIKESYLMPRNLMLR